MSELRPTESLGQDIQIPEGITAGPDFRAWATDLGFADGRRGTYRNPDSFLYIKNCYNLKTPEDVAIGLDVVRHMTAKGILHPATQWGAFKWDNEAEGYQIFAVSPKIEAFTLSDHLGTEHERKLSKNNPPEESHLTEWARRIEPNFVPGEPPAEDSLFWLLNFTEASHPDNWGWDETGKLYPVDVEVIALAYDMNVARKWHSEHSSELGN